MKHAGKQLQPDERASVDRTESLRQERERGFDSLVATPSPSQGARSGAAAYLDGLLRRPGLDVPGEADLVRRARQGDARARELLVEEVMPRLVAMARGFYRSGIEFADLLQEGCLALFDALGRFDESRGVPFWAYASPWVRGAMYRLVHDQTRAMRLPPRALTELGRLKRAVAELSSELGEDPSLALAAARAGLERQRAELLAAAGRPPRSLDEAVAGEDAVASLVDVLPDPSSEAAYDAVVEAASAPQLRTLLGALSERERDILARRHGIGRNPETLDAVARDLGVTRERVRQVEARALTKLRAAASRHDA